MILPRLNDPLWMALYRALTDHAQGQEQAAEAAEAAWLTVKAQGYRLTASTHRRRLKLAKDYGVPLEGDVAFSQGYDVSLNPHDVNTPDAMRWLSDWWKANADAYESHIYGAAEAQEDEGPAL